MSTTEQIGTAVPTGTWQADVVHSSGGFEVPYMGISTFSGTVKDFDATLVDGSGIIIYFTVALVIML